MTNNNATIKAAYKKYTDDQIKYAVQSTNKHTSAFQYVMDNPAWEFTDEDDTKGFKKTDKDYHKTNKETYEIQPSKTLFKWLLQQPFGSKYVPRFKLMNIALFTNYILQFLLIVLLLKYQLSAVLKLFQK